MNKIYISIMILMMGTVLFACSREMIEPQEECEQEVTYTNDVSNLIDASCAYSGCHINGSAPGEFSSYEGLKPYLENDQFRNRALVIQNMPPAGVDQLTDEEIELLNCWVTGNYIE